jgi:hypothetical protein
LRHFDRIVAVVLLLVVACGDEAFRSLGENSSGWIGEPTLPSTTTIPTTVPVVVGSEILKWFNDAIVTVSLDDPEALREEIFQRRGGDLIVQSSRAEIEVLLPDLQFPRVAPYLAEYVSSQLVFDGDGRLSDDPVASFGIWSSEPYTRSRSVAQMVVLNVSLEDDTTEGLEGTSCARFSNNTTQGCETRQIGNKTVWSLRADNGNTMVWFDGAYRYDLFGRTFVPLATLEEMIPSFAPIRDLTSGPE